MFDKSSKEDDYVEFQAMDEGEMDKEDGHETGATEAKQEKPEKG